MVDSSPPEPGRRRRTEGLRRGGRSARVVQSVLEATLAELGRVGYVALRFEDVAALSGVNKTTIYRRWPTKAELVRSSILDLGVEEPLHDSGSIRADLVAAVSASVTRLADPGKLGLLRMLQAVRGDPEVDEIVRALRTRHRGLRVDLVKRAIARGELPPGTNAELVVEVILSTIYSRVTQLGEPVDDRFVESVVDLVLAGARAAR
jgi:AcrR family transcriptional regulator